MVTGKYKGGVTVPGVTVRPGAEGSQRASLGSIELRQEEAGGQEARVPRVGQSAKRLEAKVPRDGVLTTVPRGTSCRGRKFVKFNKELERSNNRFIIKPRIHHQAKIEAESELHFSNMLTQQTV